MKTIEFDDELLRACQSLGSIYSKYWIPVKHMLPPEDGVYLVTGTALDRSFTVICDYSKEFGWKSSVYEIVAWMPLLPPYKRD